MTHETFVIDIIMILCWTSMDISYDPLAWLLRSSNGDSRWDMSCHKRNPALLKQVYSRLLNAEKPESLDAWLLILCFIHSFAPKTYSSSFTEVKYRLSNCAWDNANSKSNRIKYWFNFCKPYNFKWSYD